MHIHMYTHTLTTCIHTTHAYAHPHSHPQHTYIYTGTTYTPHVHTPHHRPTGRRKVRRVLSYRRWEAGRTEKVNSEHHSNPDSTSTIVNQERIKTPVRPAVHNLTQVAFPYVSHDSKYKLSQALLPRWLRVARRTCRVKTLGLWAPGTSGWTEPAPAGLLVPCQLPPPLMG